MMLECQLEREEWVHWVADLIGFTRMLLLLTDDSARSRFSPTKYTSEAVAISKQWGLAPSGSGEKLWAGSRDKISDRGISYQDEWQEVVKETKTKPSVTLRGLCLTPFVTEQKVTGRWRRRSGATLRENFDQRVQWHVVPWGTLKIRRRFFSPCSIYSPCHSETVWCIYCPDASNVFSSKKRDRERKEERKRKVGKTESWFSSFLMICI